MPDPTYGSPERCTLPPVAARMPAYWATTARWPPRHVRPAPTAGDGVNNRAISLPRPRLHAETSIAKIDYSLSGTQPHLRPRTCRKTRSPGTRTCLASLPPACTWTTQGPGLRPHLDAPPPTSSNDLRYGYIRQGLLNPRIAGHGRLGHLPVFSPARSANAVHGGQCGRSRTLRQS